MVFKTFIEIDGKRIFSISSNDQEEFNWESYASTSKKEHSVALLELVRIGFEIAKLKITNDEKRINDSDGPIVFG